MLRLNTPVERISKVGPKYKKLLENLEITDVKSFLYHFPFRYDDFTSIKLVRDLQEGETATVQGILSPVENIFTKTGKKLTKAKIVDNTGDLDLVWFNQHYLKKVLLPGETYNISGKITTFNNKLCMMSPETEIKRHNSLNTGRLVPVYPETAGISSKWLRGRINEILENIEDMDEILPSKILDKYNYPVLVDALNHIHFPENPAQIKHARSRFAFEELLVELLKVEKKKNEWDTNLKGHQIKLDDTSIKNFIKDLPFTLTNTQSNAVNQILEDMTKANPMNRLLEGDVGTGKTIVAVIAAYAISLNRLKTVYLAPTELLANQHFETFTNFLTKHGLKVTLLTGASKTNETDWDVLIGTHAVFYDTNKYKNIGLIVIDEQHRFGVEQRGKILEKSTNQETPHLLTMTATPIPRTLALTIYGDLAISVLDQHPNSTRKIFTRVVSNKNRDEAYEWIKNKNESTFIVCPLIEASDKESMTSVKAAEVEYTKLRNGIFKNMSIGLVHGRQKSAEKQKIIDEFKSGNIQTLVATPVIEVGIDIPEASIMVIESAERYGLATLHQLRGRVGRGNKPGYCFIFMSDDSKSSYDRLKHLESVNNGLELAEIDLANRGQGDLFSTMQHGFKKFRIADLSDSELLQKVKVEAQDLFLEINEHKALKKLLDVFSGPYVKNN